MAWTANLIEVERGKGMVTARIQLISDAPGSTPIDWEIFGDNLDAAAIKMQVAYRLQSLNAFEAAWESASKMPKGKIDPADISSQTDPATPESVKTK